MWRLYYIITTLYVVWLPSKTMSLFETIRYSVVDFCLTLLSFVSASSLVKLFFDLQQEPDLIVSTGSDE